MIRYGILSTSSIAPRFIAAVRESGAGEIAALSSRTLEKAAEKAAEWRIPRAYGCHMALLEDPEVDAVYISTVNAQHEPWAREALLHGKHVVCEKPCTTSAAGTKALFELAAERGLFLMEAQKMLFLPAVLEVRRWIDSGALGTVRMAEFNHSFDASYNTWMYDASAGGGPLLSSAIYVIELLQFLFGCSVAGYHGFRTVHPGTDVEEQYVLSGRMESGVLFSAKNSTVAPLENRAVIYGEQGWAELPDYWKARCAVLHRKDGTEERAEFPCAHELIYEARHIRDCLEKGLLQSPVVTGDFSVRAIRTLEQIRNSWT